MSYFVQGNNATASGNVTVAFPSNVGAGNLIATWTKSGAPADVLTSTDTLSNSYVVVYNHAGVAQTTHAQNISYAKNIAGGACSVSTNGWTTGVMRFCIHEVQGMDTVAPLDQSTFSNGNSTTATSGNVTPSQAAEYAFGTVDWGTGAASITANSPWVLEQNSGDSIATEDQDLTSTAPLQASFTRPTGPWDCFIVTFKAASRVPYDLAHSPQHQSFIAQ